MDKEGHSVIKRHAFGMSSGADGCLQWLDEGSLMYPSGKTVVLHNIASNTQRFLEASYQSTAITAMTVSANRKFIAIAEAGSIPQVQIIDSVTRKRRKVLTVMESIQSDRFVCMSFSADGRHLVTQGGGPGWHLLYWNWERSKPLAAVSLSFVHDTSISISGGIGGGEENAGGASMEVWGSRKGTSPAPKASFMFPPAAAPGGSTGPGSSLPLGSNGLHSPPLVTHVEVCPADPLLLTVSGAGIMRFYVYRDAMLTPVGINGLPRETQEVFLSHTWLPGGKRLIAATQRGDLLLIANGLYIGMIPVPPQESTSFLASPPAFSTLSPTRQGFVAGTDNGLLCIYSSNTEMHHYLKSSSGVTGGSTSANAGSGPLPGSHSPFLPSQKLGRPPSASGKSGTWAKATGSGRKRDAGGDMGSGSASTLVPSNTLEGTGHATGSQKGIHSNAPISMQEGSGIYGSIGSGGGTVTIPGSGVLNKSGYEIPGSEEDLNFTLIYQMKVPQYDPSEEVLDAVPHRMDYPMSPGCGATTLHGNSPHFFGMGTGVTGGAEMDPPNSNLTGGTSIVPIGRSGRESLGAGTHTSMDGRPVRTASATPTTPASTGTLTTTNTHGTTWNTGDGTTGTEDTRKEGLSSRQTTKIGAGDSSTSFKKPFKVGMVNGTGTTLAGTGGEAGKSFRKDGPPGAGGIGTGGNMSASGAALSSFNDTDKSQRLKATAEEALLDAQRHHTRLPYGIVALALDQGESHLALATHAGRVYGFTFQQDWMNMTPTKEPEMEPICQRLHTGRINGMDCSVRKPFLITSSSDGSVRVWNTSTNKLEICTYFRQEPGAVAIHPNGLMAAICFSSKVCVMNILWSCLRDRRDINFRNATLVRFSVGGQYIAVGHGNLIDIFYSATCELYGQLRGHPQKVRDMKWCATSPYPTDNRLITCSTDGMILDWNMTEMRKETEHFEKRFQYIAVASDDRNVWVVAAPTSATVLDAYWKVTLREMDRLAMDAANGCASEDYEFTETSIQQLLVAPHQRILFGGCEDGSLKMMPFPLQTGVQLPPITAHAGAITQMCLSFDESTLFTGSEDGSFFVWSIREEGGGRIKGGQQDQNFLADEVLVTTQEIDEKKLEMEVLQQLIERLRTDLDSEEKRRNHEQGTRLRERTEEFKSEVAALAAQYAALWNAKAEQERSFVTIKLEKDTDVSKEMEQLERTKQSEVEQLEEECDALQTTLQNELVLHAEQLKELERQIFMDTDEDAAHFNDVLSQRKETMEKLSRQLERSQQTNTEAIHQLELDTDAELLGVYEKHSATLSTLRDRFLRMKGEGAIMRKNAVRMEKEIEVRTNEIRLLDQAKAALTFQLSELSHRMSQLHQDIDERDVVIGEREKTIYALKKQNQELEKHKFVLDHRIRQLKAQMEPKQREIVYHNQKIMQKNSELENFHSSNMTLVAKIEDLKKDLVQQREQRAIWINKTKDFETYKKRFQKDVTDLIPAIQEPALLKAAVEKLYQTHFVARHGQRIAQADPAIQREFADQLGYLSTSVEALSHKVKADQLRHKKEVADMMMENLSLIREIHDLREEIQELRALIAADEASQRSLFGGAGKKRKGGKDGGAGPGRGKKRPLRPGSSGSSASSAARRGELNTTPGGLLHNLSGSNYSTGATGSGRAKANLTPAGDAGVPGLLSSVATTTSGVGGGGGPPSVGGVAGGSRRLVGTYQSDIPEKPHAIESNRVELRMLRAYIEAMERSIGMALTGRRRSSVRLVGLKESFGKMLSSEDRSGEGEGEDKVQLPVLGSGYSNAFSATGNRTTTGSQGSGTAVGQGTRGFSVGSGKGEAAGVSSPAALPPVKSAEVEREGGS